MSDLSPIATRQLDEMRAAGCRVYARCDEAGKAYVSVECAIPGTRSRYFHKSTSVVSREAAVERAYWRFMDATANGALTPNAIDRERLDAWNQAAKEETV